jgi:hypothetical protein
MMRFDENDDDSSEDNEYNEFTADIIAEIKYDKKIEIISFYKEKLSKEPEFIGIKNICTGKILSYIIDIVKPEKLTKKDYKLNYEQYLIFIDIYSELNLIGNYNIFNSVTKKIFNEIYV